MIRIGNQDCIERPDRQAWIGRRPESNDDIVIGILERQPPLDRLAHLRLDVLRVDPPVGADAACEPDGEPTAGGAEISHDAAFGNVERVHDLLGALPDVAIGTLELTEVLGRDQFPVLLPLLAGDGCPGEHQHGQQRSKNVGHRLRLPSLRSAF